MPTPVSGQRSQQLTPMEMVGRDRGSEQGVSSLVRRNTSVRRMCSEGKDVEPRRAVELERRQEETDVFSTGLWCFCTPASTGPDSFCSRLSFQGYLSSQQPWRIEIVLSSGAEGKFVCCPVK